MMTRKLCSIRKPGPWMPAGISRKARACGRGNGLPPARRSPRRRHWRIVSARRPPACSKVEVRRHHHFVAPGFARAPAVLFQVVGGGGDEIGGGIDHVAPAVAVEVDRVAQEGGRHELRRPEGAGPGADEPAFRHVAVLQDFQRGEELVPEIVLAPADAGERRGRAQHRAVAALVAVVAFHAPDRRDDIAADAIGAFGAGEGVRIFLEQRAALGDARVGHQDVEIVPDRFGELGLAVELVHDAEIRRQPARGARENAARDAATRGRGPQSCEALPGNVPRRARMAAALMRGSPEVPDCPLQDGAAARPAGGIAPVTCAPAPPAATVSSAVSR